MESTKNLGTEPAPPLFPGKGEQPCVEGEGEKADFRKRGRNAEEKDEEDEMLRKRGVKLELEN